jgi:CxxC motif-containing protein
MRPLTCIVCPIGCSLSVEEGVSGADGFPELTISGNRCPRGAVYAREEIRAPKRVVTATCVVLNDDTASGEKRGARASAAPRRLPVKTHVPCPRERISELLADVYQTRVHPPLKVGDVLIANWRDSGINVVAARSLNG